MPSFRELLNQAKSAIDEIDPAEAETPPPDVHVPRRPRARRVRAGDDPRRGVRPPGPPREPVREQAAEPGCADRRLLRRRHPLRVRGEDPLRARLHERRVDGRRLRPLEERGPAVDHARGALARAAHPLRPPHPPSRGRRGRSAASPRVEGAPARRRRPRLPRGALPRGGRCRHARHRRHGHRRLVEPAAPDPPQRRAHRRPQGRLGQEDAHRARTPTSTSSPTTCASAPTTSSTSSAATTSSSTAPTTSRPATS